MTDLYFVIRKGTSERIVDHAGKPILVEGELVRDSKTRFANVLRCHPDDLDHVTPKEYFQRFLLPVERARYEVLQQVVPDGED